jgi:hypothetical protein
VGFARSEENAAKRFRALPGHAGSVVALAGLEPLGRRKDDIGLVAAKLDMYDAHELKIAQMANKSVDIDECSAQVPVDQPFVHYGVLSRSFSFIGSQSENVQ